MICPKCRTGEHATCPGGTRCDCQHRSDRRPASAGPTIGALYEHVRENGPVVVDGWRITAWPEGSSR